MKKHWLYKVKEERDEEERRQRYFNQHFPTWAEAFWVQLCNCVQDDFQEMKELFPQLFSQETQINRESNSLRIDYVDRPPYYHLCLAVNISEQTVTLHQIQNSPPTPPMSLLPSGPDTILTLSLNDKAQRVELSLNERVLSPEEFSEMCLRPILDLHPIELAKIRGIHVG